MVGPSLQVNGGMATVERLLIDHAPAGVEIHHISSHEEGSLIRRAVVFGRALTELVLRLRREEVSLVHIHVSQRGSTFRKAILILVARAFSMPVILHAHGSEFRDYWGNLPSRLRLVLSGIFRRCHRFIVLSQSWRKYYTEVVGIDEERVTVLLNPVECPPMVPPRTTTGIVGLLFMGRLGRRKGTFDLLKAYASLSVDTRRKSRLFLAGDGELEHASAMVAELGLTENVRLLGWVKPAQRSRLLAQSDVFVLPSYDEGLPMAMLEAMSWELPPIVTPVGGIPEVVVQRESGLIVSPGNIDQIAEALRTLIDDEELRRSLGVRARKKVLPLHITTQWLALREVYLSVIEIEDRN